MDAPDKTVTVSATATGGHGVTNPANRTLTIEDDDTRGITVSAAADGVTVAEADDPETLKHNGERSHLHCGPRQRPHRHGHRQPQQWRYRHGHGGPGEPHL